MKKIAKSCSATLLILAVLIGLAPAVPAFAAPGEGQIYQIYPSSKPISVPTRSGYSYRHLEGDSPDWRLGKLRHLVKHGRPVAGNGSIQVFEATTSSGYHLVEESLITGKLQIELKDGLKSGFHYFIRKDDTAFRDAEVRENELGAISPILLPPGDYTLLALAVGSGTPHPVSFSIEEPDETVVVSLQLVPNRILLFSRTNPPGVAQGQKATLRRLDPITMKEVWHQEMDVAGNALALSEGHYALEFPRVDGFTSQGSHGVVSRFELTSKDHSKTIVGDYLKKSGELLVSLQTLRSVQDHLGMVSFTLIGADGEHTRYPRPGDYVDTSVPTKLTVLVPDVSPGTYTVEFDIDPRTFWLPAARKVTISPEKVTKLNQELTPNPGGVTARIELPSTLGAGSDRPRLTLKDGEGRFVRRSNAQELLVDDLPPGEYELTFEHLTGYESPPPIDFRVRPGELEGPFIGYYEEGSGSLVLTMTTGPHGERLQDVQVVLTDQKHQRYAFPGSATFAFEGKMLDEKTRQLRISDLPAGVYSLEFEVPNYDNLFVDVAPQMVVVNKGRVARLHQDIKARYGSLEAHVSLPGEHQKYFPGISLRNHYGEVKAHSKTGKLLAHDLKPGNYQIIFDDHDELAAPPPIPVLIEPLQTAGPFYGEYSPKTGTLVVNYSTGSHSDRLDKVRFWVFNDKGFREMYPKDKNFIGNTESRMHSVVIEDLPQGSYSLQFLLPNADGLFASVSDRHITITKGHVAEVTQQITPRYGTIQAVIEALPDDPSFVNYPTITLRDQYEAVLAESWNGSLLADELTPGEYWVYFEDIEGYESPEPARILVEAGRTIPPVVAQYSVSKGTLVVIYDTDPKPEFLQDVQVKVVDLADGQALSLSGVQSERFGDGLRMTVKGLPVGRYLVSFAVPTAPELFPHTVDREVQVSRDNISQLSQQLRPTYGGVEASVVVSAGDNSSHRVPRIFLQDYSGRVVTLSETGHLLATELPPGKYQVIYEKLEGFLSPAPADVRITPNEIAGPFVGQYALNSGRVVVTYKTDTNPENLSKIRFWISDGQNFRRMYPFGDKFRDDKELGTRQVTIDDLPLGNYSLEFFIPDLGELFADVPEQHFSIQAGQTVELRQDFRPQYGKVTAYLDLPKSAVDRRQIPKITLRDSYDRVQKESLTGVLEADDLIPGEYLLAYESLEDCTSPDPVKLKISADTTVGPFIGKYLQRTGSLLVEYGTGPKEERLDRVRFWLIDEQNHRTMYPISQVGFEQNPATQRRRVEVNDLAEGNYRLEFLVPNVDNLFSQIPRREFKVRYHEVTHITQDIVPNYGGVDVSLTFPQRQVGGLIPQIYLKDRVGKVVAVSEDGHLSRRDVTPGRYEIAFEAVKGYDTPESLFVDVAPKQVNGPFFGVYNLAVGAMIVNYDTGSHPEFLEKVRFWLVNEQNSGAMYPQGENFIDDKDKEQRKVIISDLPAGQYHVDFLLPELNGLFADVPRQSYTVRQGEVTALEQSFLPQFSSLEARIVGIAFKNDGSRPEISLRDSKGRIVRKSSDGQILEQYLIPGAYTLEFGDVTDFTTPDPIVLDLGPKDQAGPFEAEYDQHLGDLVLRYSTGELQDQLAGITVTLTDEHGYRRVLPETGTTLELDDDGAVEIELSGLPVGMYTIDFDIPGEGQLFEPVARQEVYVKRNQAQFVYKNIRPVYGALEIVAEFAKDLRWRGSLPAIVVRDAVTKQVKAMSRDGHLNAEVLTPGDYEVVFEESPWLDVPRDFRVSVAPGRKTGPIAAPYVQGVGSATIVYNTGITQERLSEVRFWLIDEDGESRSYPHSGQVELDPKTHSYAVQLGRLPVGHYDVEFFVPNIDGLFGDFPSAELVVEKDGHAELNYALLPQYGSLEVLVQMPEGMNPETTVVVKDRLGLVRAASTSGHLEVHDLLPDTYTVSFQPVSNFDEPSEIVLALEPYKQHGPYVGAYKAGRGTLAVNYDTGPLRERLDEVRLWLTDAKGARTELNLADEAHELQDGTTRRIILHDLVFGKYAIEAFVPNEDGLFEYEAQQEFYLNKNENLVLHQGMNPMYGSLAASVARPANRHGDQLAELTLLDEAGDIVAQTLDGALDLKFLKPGIYTLSFGDDERFYAPDPVRLAVGPGESVGPIVGEFTAATGSLVVTCDCGDASDYLDLVHCKLRNELGEEWNFPEQNASLSFKDQTAQISIESLPVGKYTAEFLVPNDNGLFAAAEPYQFSVRRDEQSRVVQSMQPRFARLQAGIDLTALEVLPERVPVVQLREESGRLIAESSAGGLDINTLKPGTYVLSFEEISGYHTPADQVLNVEPEAIYGPILGAYGQRYGAVNIYATLPEGLQSEDYPTQISLLDAEGEIQAKGMSGHLISDTVLPGTYKVQFSKHSSLFEPAPVNLVVEADQQATDLIADYRYASGDLLIAYDVGDAPDFLESVKITLRDRRGNSFALPREQDQTRVLDTHSAELVVRSFPVGEYTVEIKVDGDNKLFADALDGELVILKQKETQFTHHLVPRWGKLQATIDLSQAVTQPLETPRIFLKTNGGRILSYSDTGTIQADHLQPGDYRIEYSQVKGFVAPADMLVSVGPGEVKDQNIGTYHQNLGTLVVQLDGQSENDRLEGISLTVWDESGQALAFLSGDEIQRDEGGQFLATLSGIPVGAHRVEFHLPSHGGLFVVPEPQIVEIKKNQEQLLVHSFQPHFGSLFAKAEVDSAVNGGNLPKIILQDADGEIVARADDGNLAVDRLLPGEYRLYYESMKGLNCPAPQTITILPDQMLGPIVGNYADKVGALNVSYATSPKAEYLDDISFTVSRGDGSLVGSYPQPDTRDTGTKRSIRIPSLPIGDYVVSFLLPESNLLLPDGLDPVKVTVRENDTASIIQEITPRYGGVELALALPAAQEGRSELPLIRVLDDEGNLVTETSEGYLLDLALAPGTYQIDFEEIDVCFTPESQTIEVKPHEITGPLLGQYKEASGTMVVQYNTGPKSERLDEVAFWLVAENGSRTRYPQEPGQAISADFPGREVVLLDIPVGDYQIYFSAPNADGLFGRMPSQKVTVTKHEPLLVQETLQPRYGGLIASIDISENLRSKAVAALFAQAGTGTDGPVPDTSNWLPAIELLDADGVLLMRSETGDLTLQDLKPGDYHIMFEDLPDCAQARPVHVRIGPEEVKGPFQHSYEPAKGALLINYGTGNTRIRLADIAFTLTDGEGNERHYPEADGYLPDVSGYGREIAIRDIPVGAYKIQFSLPNEDGLFAEVDEREIYVERDLTARVSERFEPRFASIELDLELEMAHRLQSELPVMTLLNSENQTVTVSFDGHLQKDELLPGRYRVEYTDLPNYYTPEPLVLNLEPGAQMGPMVARYEIGKGEAVVTYQTGKKRERLERIRFWLIDQDGNRELYPREGEFTDNTVTGYREVHISQLPLGAYTLEWVLPNTDSLFKPIDERTLVVNKDEQVTWTELMQPRYGSLDVAVEVAMEVGETLPQPEVWVSDPFGRVVSKGQGAHLHITELIPGDYQVAFKQAHGYETPDPVTVSIRANEAIGPVVGKYRLQDVPLTVHTNDDRLEWTLLRNGVEVFRGKGSANRVMLPPGTGYYLEPVPVQGFEAEVSPSGTFKLDPGKEATADVKFECKYGALHFEAALRDGEVVTVVLTPEHGTEEVRRSLHAEGGTASWTLDKVPTGLYSVQLELPEYYHEVALETVQIFKDDVLDLSPQISPKRKIRVESNAEGASFELASNETGKHWSLSGSAVTFTDLLPGKYRLSFGDDGKGRLVPPSARTIEIEPSEDLTVYVPFKKGASLVVSSNVDEYRLHIESLDEDSVFDQTIVDATEFFTLPEGRYRVSYLPLEGQMAIRYGPYTPDPAEVTLSAARPQRVHRDYEARAGSLVVTSNLPTASYTVRDVSNPEGLVLGRFRGDYSVIPMTFTGQYEVTFDDVPNYETPLSVRIKVESEQRQIVGGHYVPVQLMVRIEKGVSILGDVHGEGAEDEKPARTIDLDAYSIGMYTVSNAQYASWLTKVVREGLVAYIDQGPRKGVVTDLDGNLLCETAVSDGDSHLSVKAVGDSWGFFAADGFEETPMVEVTWFGANAFCEEQGYRLPTEAEWEKAASIAISHVDGSVKKYRYGCGSDDIDSSLANYMDNYDKESQYLASVREVGFYNGINMLHSDDILLADLEIDPDILEHASTGVGHSPYGLYDMSGNVREWVSDWYSLEGHKQISERNPKGVGHGQKRVTKGGCYDSFAYEVRSSARMPLQPEKADPYTGFRVVLDG